jgi:hypothetical protein
MAFIHKRDVFWMLFVIVGALLASRLSALYGYAWLFWFFGGAIMGLGVFACYAEKPKRTVSRLIVGTLLTGLLTSLGSLLIDYINF